MYNKNPLLNLDDGAVNKAMVDGLKQALHRELKDYILENIENMVEPVIQRIVDRMKLSLYESPGDEFMNRDINLVWLLKKE